MSFDSVVAALIAAVDRDTDNDGVIDTLGTAARGDQPEAARLLADLVAAKALKDRSDARNFAQGQDYQRAVAAHAQYLADVAAYSTTLATAYAALDRSVRSAEEAIQAVAIFDAGHYLDDQTDGMHPATPSASEAIAFQRATTVVNTIKRFERPESVLRGLCRKPVADAIRIGVEGCVAALEAQQSAPVEDPNIVRLLQQIPADSMRAKARVDAAFNAALDVATQFVTYLAGP